MAKKKGKKKPNELIDDDLEDLEDEEIEISLPKIGIKTQDISELEGEPLSPTDDVIEEDYDAELELDLEEKPEIQDYKYLKLKIYRLTSEDDYEVDIIGQTHGFCNIFVKHLLNTDGVKLAAYKVTGIIPSRIFIRLEKGKKIKVILHKGIESLREEVLKVEKIFQKLM